MSSPPAADFTVDYSVFEGLFVRVFNPDAKFAEDLKAIGFDLKHPQLRYPAKVWHDALQVAHRHVYPAMKKEEAHRELGRRFIEGFFSTITGKVIAVALPFLGADALIKRIPKFSSMASRGTEVAVRKEGDQWVLTYKGPFPDPDFVAGVLEGNVNRTNNLRAIDVRARTATGYELVVKHLHPVRR